MPPLLEFTLPGIACETIRVRGDWPILARINWTGDEPVIQAVGPGVIMVPAGDGVRGGIALRTKFVVKLATFDGGVGARIGAGPVARGAPIVVTVPGPRGMKVLGVGDRVTVIEVWASVRVGIDVNWVRPDPDTSTMYGIGKKLDINWAGENTLCESYPVLSLLVASVGCRWTLPRASVVVGQLRWTKKKEKKKKV